MYVYRKKKRGDVSKSKEKAVERGERKKVGEKQKWREEEGKRDRKSEG